MRIPVIRGIIDRRILVNYRVDPQVLAKMLPAPFQPKLVAGVGMAGVCLIRLKHIRPKFIPSFVGISSENAAHRIAVEWEQDGEMREGVFIPRRDTSSRLNTLLGGRLFHGVHHHATFVVQERDDRYRIVLDSDDHQTHLLVEGFAASKLPVTSVFRSIQEASAFFQQGSLGYSMARKANEFEGLELRSFNWQVEPLAIEQVESSFFENPFPASSVEFDCALLMRNIDHEWRGRETLIGNSRRCGSTRTWRPLTLHERMPKLQQPPFPC